jgi:hypothetical protein
LEALKTPDLVNAFKDQQVSTLGANVQRNEASRNSSTAIDALRGGGTRAIIGGIGAVQDNNNKVNADIGANLDEQQKAINVNKAQDDVNIRNMVESRYQDDVLGLSSQINSAEDSKQKNIANAFQGLYGASQGGFGGAKDKKNTKGDKGKVFRDMKRPPSTLKG